MFVHVFLLIQNINWVCVLSHYSSCSYRLVKFGRWRVIAPLIVIELINATRSLIHKFGSYQFTVTSPANFLLYNSRFDFESSSSVWNPVNWRCWITTVSVVFIRAVIADTIVTTTIMFTRGQVRLRAGVFAYREGGGFGDTYQRINNDNKWALTIATANIGWCLFVWLLACLLACEAMHIWLIVVSAREGWINSFIWLTASFINERISINYACFDRIGLYRSAELGLYLSDGFRGSFDCRWKFIQTDVENYLVIERVKTKWFHNTTLCVFV